MKVALPTCLIVFFLLPINVLLAQSSLQEPGYSEESIAQSYMLKHWGIDDGIPNSAVMAMVKGTNDYIWIATYDGIARFDGHQYTKFNQSTHPVLETNSFYSLAEDAAGRLYLGSNGGGLYRLYQGEITKIEETNLLPNNTITALYAEGDSIWVGTREGLALFYDNKFQNFKGSERFKGLSIHALERTSYGTLLVGTLSNGLFELAKDKVSLLNSGVTNKSVRSIFEDKQGVIWVGAEDGIYQLDNGGLVPQKPMGREFATFVNSIKQGASNSIWIATNQGLLKYANGNYQLVDEQDGLALIDLQTLVIDEEENIWVGLYRNGLVKLRPRTFTVYSTSNGLPHQTINAIATINNQGWIGTQNGLAIIENKKVRNIEVGTSSEEGRVRSILPQTDQKFLIGTYDGLFQYKLNGKPQKIKGSENLKVRSIYQVNDDMFWVGTRYGLYQYSPSSGKFRIVEMLKGTFILDITQDVQGKVWVATNGKGLFRYDKAEGKWDNFTTDNSALASDIVFNIYTTPSGLIWFGTNSGLTLYDQGAWFSKSEREKFITNTIFQVLQDKQYNYWLTSNRGLFYIQEADLVRFMKAKTAELSQVRHFTASDGMQGSEITSVSRSAIDEKGQLWVAGQSGLSIINTTDLTLNRKAPTLEIQEAWVDGNLQQSVNGKISLPAGAKHLEIRYTGFNYRAPKKINFWYKLDGFDKDWIKAGNRREAYYTSLPIGEYNFLLKASNEDGIVVEEPVAITIEQEAFIYQENWFAFIIVLALTFLLIIAYRLRTSHLNKVNKRLSRLVADRTHSIVVQKDAIQQQKEELGRLNNMKDKLLSVLSHDLRQPFTSISGLLTLLNENQINQQEFAKLTNLINQQVKYQVHMLDNVLHWTKNQLSGFEAYIINFQLYPLVQEITAIYQGQAQNKQIRLINNVDNVFTIDADHDVIHLVVRNLISNALKFTDTGGVVEVIAEKEPETYRIIVADNGVGIPEEKLAKLMARSGHQEPLRGTQNEKGAGLGLSLCKEFAEICGGQLVVESKVGVGSRFILELPVQVTVKEQIHQVALSEQELL